MDKFLNLINTKDIDGLVALKEELKDQIMLNNLNWMERAELYKKIQFINNCINRLKGEDKMVGDIKSLLQEILKNQRETNTRLDTMDLRLSSVENRTITAESNISEIKESFTILKSSVNESASRPLLDGQT